MATKLIHILADMPKAESGKTGSVPGLVYNSPRANHLQEVAISTLRDQDVTPPVRWQDHQQPLQLILQTFSTVSDQADDFWFATPDYFVKKEYTVGQRLYEVGDEPDGFFLLESGILKARYQLPQGTYSELILAGTTCGELPFFSNTSRTATVSAETDCVTWMLDKQRWDELQATESSVAQELLKISLKLTKERMDTITK